MAKPRKDGTPANHKGGRKKGALTVASRRKATSLIAELHVTNETPLDLMIQRMLFWHRSAENLLADIETKIKKDTLSKEDQSALVGLLAEFRNADQKIYSYAEGCAPYMHARLASTTVKTEQNTSLTITMQLDKPALGEDRSYRERFKPLENNTVLTPSFKREDDAVN